MHVEVVRTGLVMGEGSQMKMWLDGALWWEMAYGLQDPEESDTTGVWSRWRRWGQLSNDSVFSVNPILK